MNADSHCLGKVFWVLRLVASSIRHMGNEDNRLEPWLAELEAEVEFTVLSYCVGPQISKTSVQRALAITCGLLNDRGSCIGGHSFTA